MHGRRSFLKRLGAALGAITLQGKLNALAEHKRAVKYPETYKKNSLPPLRNVQGCSGVYCITGSYIVSG